METEPLAELTRGGPSVDLTHLIQWIIVFIISRPGLTQSGLTSSFTFTHAVMSSKMVNRALPSESLSIRNEKRSNSPLVGCSTYNCPPIISKPSCADRV